MSPDETEALEPFAMPKWTAGRIVSGSQAALRTRLAATAMPPRTDADRAALCAGLGQKGLTRCNMIPEA